MRLAVALIFVLSVGVCGSLSAQERPQREDPYRRFFRLPGIEFSQDQQAKVDEIRKKLTPKLIENRDKWNSVITQQQLEARRAAFRKARAAGKQGRELREAVSEAVQLTEQQQAQQAATLEERNALFRQIRTELTALLTDRQQASVRRRQRAQSQIPPTHADVKYGPHPRNVMDVWLAETDKPAPLVVYIHGGGFRAGSKNSASTRMVRGFLDSGISVAAINYRLTDTDPFPAAHHDSARAVQFLRHKAKDWDLDPKRFGATGGSAGGGISMWLAFHDDLADPDSDDPVARQSTRLTCAVVNAAQSSYDPRYTRSIGLPRLEEHPFFLPFYGITREEIDSPKAHKLYDEAAAITHLTQDDVPVMALYSGGNVPITDETSLGVIVHHPKFGIALQERMEELGIQCVVSYRGQPDPPRVTALQFFQKHFGVESDPQSE